MWCFAHFDLQMCFSQQRRAILFKTRTSKIGPSPRCFVHFDLKMCFATQPFWDIRTSKIRPNLWCLAQFDLKMRFVPQRRAIFRLSPSVCGTATFPPAARIIEKTQRFATSLTLRARVPSFY